MPDTHLLTFSTYGSHLPGDDRGWSHYARGAQPPSEALRAHSIRLMRGPIVCLDPDARIVVLRAMIELCGFRGWTLHTAHVRTQHVHAIVTGLDPERMIRDSKAWSTRPLRAKGLYGPEARIWARGGSWVPLRTEDEVSTASHYVYERQGDPMARWP